MSEGETEAREGASDDAVEEERNDEIDGASAGKDGEDDFDENNNNSSYSYEDEDHCFLTLSEGEQLKRATQASLLEFYSPPRTLRRSLQSKVNNAVRKDEGGTETRAGATVSDSGDVSTIMADPGLSMIMTSSPSTSPQQSHFQAKGKFHGSKHREVMTLTASTVNNTSCREESVVYEQLISSPPDAEILNDATIHQQLASSVIKHLEEELKFLGLGTSADQRDSSIVSILKLSMSMLEQARDAEEGEWGEKESRHRTSSIASSINAFNVKYNSEALISNLGDEPTEAELCNVIQGLSIDDGRKFAAIPQYSEIDLLIGKHLGEGSFSNVYEVTVTNVEDRVDVAMKCLRPQIRSNAEQYIIGVKDLVHEAVMLSSLDHPNIIKIHGRSELGDGYFILLDKLQDTLNDRIKIWQNDFPNSSNNPPSLQQVRVAMAAADALAYLHDRQIVFRDLKPANVGFDSRGVLKLFDFGFAIGLNHVEGEVLYDRAGTLRYMAPEVGLDVGHGLPADVYSFSILLWEIFAVKKPFGKIKDFTTVVFQNGERPKVGKNWPQELKVLLEDSWSTNPGKRPTMEVCKNTLEGTLRTLQRRGSIDRRDNSQVMRASLRRSFRMSWDG